MDKSGDKRGAPTVGSKPEMAKAGKRPGLDHPLGGVDLATLISVLRRNGLPAADRLGPVGIALGSAVGRLPLSLAEAVWFEAKRRGLPKMPAPLFILGHWRSGTTHLYNLFSKDPAYGYISPIAVGLPWDLLLLGRALRPMLEKQLPESRLIDNVPVKPDSPQEDEIALANMTALSFYHGLYFPKRFHENFRRGIFFEDCRKEEIQAWAKTFVYYLEKVCLEQGGKRLLIKNPVYTARVGLLRQIWPDAQFIHIHRDPRAVFVSMLGFYRNLLPALALQPYDHLDIPGIVLEYYPRIMQALLTDTADLPPSQFVETAFETFEREPLAEARRIYDTLGLPGWAEAVPRFEAYVASVRDYAKNKHRMDPELKVRVEERWAPFVARWGDPALV